MKYEDPGNPRALLRKEDLMRTNVHFVLEKKLSEPVFYSNLLLSDYKFQLKNNIAVQCHPSISRNHHFILLNVNITTTEKLSVLHNKLISDNLHQGPLWPTDLVHPLNIHC